MDGWMMTPQDMENHATQAMDNLVEWLHDNDYLTDKQHKELKHERPVALYRRLS